MVKVIKSLIVFLTSITLSACGGGGVVNGNSNENNKTENIVSVSGVAFYSNDYIKNADINIKCRGGIVYTAKTNQIGWYELKLPTNAPPCGIKLDFFHDNNSMTLYSAIASNYSDLNEKIFNVNYFTDLVAALVTLDHGGKWHYNNKFDDFTLQKMHNAIQVLDDRLNLSGIIKSLEKYSPFNNKINDGVFYSDASGSFIKNLESCLIKNTVDSYLLKQSVVNNKDVGKYFKTEDFYENWQINSLYSESLFAPKVYVGAVAAFIADKNINTSNNEPIFRKYGRRVYFGKQPFGDSVQKYASEIEKIQGGKFINWITSYSSGIWQYDQAALYAADKGGNLIKINNQLQYMGLYKFEGDQMRWMESNCRNK